MTPTGLSDLLEGISPATTRLVVVHERRRRFRYLSLLELALALAFAVCLLACLIVAFVLMAVLDGDELLGGDDVDGWFPKVRFFHYWHELVLRTLDAQGQVLAEVRHAPASQEEGDGLVGSLLAAAARDGLVVVETLSGSSGSLRESLTVWFGGQPLLVHPDRRSEEEAARVLISQGKYQLAEGKEDLVLLRPGRAPSRLKGGVAVFLHLLCLPVALFSRSFRETLRHAWLDMKGVPGPDWRFTISKARQLEVLEERGGRPLFRVVVDARDLLGISYAPALGYDRDVTRSDAHLRLVEREQSTTVPVQVPYPSMGRALRDFLVAGAQRVWEGIPSTPLLPLRCPYCGNVYTFEPGVGCPSCGAPPDRAL